MSQGRQTRNLRVLAKTVVFAVLRYSGIAFLTRHAVQPRRVTVLAYHDPAPHVFEQHLARLERMYSIVSLGEFLTARRQQDFGSLPKHALVITLDDGWRGNADLLPIIRKRGVRPCVFACTSIIGTHRHFWWTHVAGDADAECLKGLSDEERLNELESLGFAPETEYPHRQALSLDEVVEMSPWFDFESHSRSHPVLPCTSDDRAAEEIGGSADDVERLRGVRPAAFAYPNGDASERDVGLVRAAGYECAFTIDPGFNDEKTDVYRMPRIYVDDTAGANELVVCASGAYGIMMAGLRRLLSARTGGQLGR